MRQIIDIPVSRIRASQDDVLEAQGIARSVEPSEKIQTLFYDAITRFDLLAEPIGIIQRICREEFDSVYANSGRNDRDTPLEAIVPRASALAFCAATLGQPISQRISDLFGKNDFALATMLDAVASIGADNCGRYMEEILRRDLQKNPLEAGDITVMLYSPGYCGWHISGQEALFASLQPGNVGIQLNGSFLMDPLKSISGLLVAGTPEIHRFKNDYPFCDGCRNRSCVRRMQQLNPKHTED